VSEGEKLQAAYCGAQRILDSVVQGKNPYDSSAKPGRLAANVLVLMELGMDDSPPSSLPDMQRRILAAMRKYKDDPRLLVDSTAWYSHEPLLDTSTGMSSQDALARLPTQLQSCTTATVAAFLDADGIPTVAYPVFHHLNGPMFCTYHRVIPFGGVTKVTAALRGSSAVTGAHTSNAMALDPGIMDHVHAWLGGAIWKDSTLDCSSLTDNISQRLEMLNAVLLWSKGESEREAVMKSRLPHVFKSGGFPTLSRWLLKTGEEAGEELFEPLQWFCKSTQPTLSLGSMITLKALENEAKKLKNVEAHRDFAQWSGYEVIKAALELTSVSDKKYTGSDGIVGAESQSVLTGTKVKFTHEDKQRMANMVQSCELFQKHRDRIYDMLDHLMATCQAKGMVTGATTIQLCTDAAKINFELNSDPYVLHKILREVLAVPNATGAEQLKKFGIMAAGGLALKNHPVFVQQLASSGKFHTGKYSQVFELVERCRSKLPSYMFLYAVYGYDLGLTDGFTIGDSNHDVHAGAFTEEFCLKLLAGPYENINWWKDFLYPLLKAKFDADFPDPSNERMYANHEFMTRLKPFFLRAFGSVGRQPVGDFSPNVLMDRIMEMIDETAKFRNQARLQADKQINEVFTSSLKCASEETALVANSLNVEERFSSCLLSQTSVALNARIKDITESRQVMRLMLKNYPDAAKVLSGDTDMKAASKAKLRQTVGSDEEYLEGALQR